MSTPFDRVERAELAATATPWRSAIDQAWGPQRGFPNSTGVPLSSDALYYGNQPSNVPMWGGGGYPPGGFYNSGGAGGRFPFANPGFSPQSLAYYLPMAISALTGNYTGGFFNYGGFNRGMFGYGPYGGGLPFSSGGFGGGIMPLAMGLGGLFGGARGFGLGGLFGLGLMGLGRLFRNRGGGGGWDRGPRPQPYDGGDNRPTPNPDSTDHSSEEAKLVALLNRDRGRNRALESNAGLVQAAEFMAVQMQGRNLRNDPGMHNLNGPGMEKVRTPADRIAKIGKISGVPTGECMAQGNSAQAVYDMLMSDPPHRAIMMSGNYNSIGVKRVGNMWVLDFARV